MKADVIADTFRDEVRSEVAKYARPLRLVGILSTSAAPSRSYAEFTQKMCHALGIDFVLKKIGSAKSEELSDGDGIEEAIIEANEDEDVDGIMVSRLPSQRAKLSLK